MSSEINKDNVILGNLVVLKFPLKNDYKIKDWDWSNGYDCWVDLDKEVSISKYHRKDYPIIGKIIEINEDNVLIEHCFEPFVWITDNIPHSLMNIKYEDLEINNQRINEYIKYNLGDEYINTNRLCGHKDFYNL